jgi:phospholipid-binding lipoprotein MlaA
MFINSSKANHRKNILQLACKGALIGMFGTVSGCATTQSTEQTHVANPVDPYENFNRTMYGFNNSVDGYVAKPISDAYRWVTPQFMQSGVSNFFNNLKNVNVVINDVLQAKFQQSAQDTGRLALNTTLGLGGIFDVANSVGWQQNDEDFEQTLAVWGVPQGSYLVLPLLGPSSARGIPGSVFDTAANPASYVGLPVQLLSMLNARANAEGSLKFIDEAALDPYVFTREAFLQWRNNLATDGKAEASADVLDLEDEVEPSKKAAAVVTSKNEQLPKDNNVVQSLDQAAKSFEEANSKIDKLKAKKYKKRK